LSIIKNDPDDDKFLECAVALDCKIIVSGDKHLKDLITICWYCYLLTKAVH